MVQALLNGSQILYCHMGVIWVTSLLLVLVFVWGI
jgi:hypothetical protein